MTQSTAIEDEYKKFNKVRTEYRNLMEENTTINQRRFSFRIDATYSLKNSSKDWIEVDENNNQKQCYILYLILVDVWFSYEALLHLASEENFTSIKSAPPEKLLKSKIQNDLVIDIVNEFYSELSPIISKAQRKSSLLKYITTLINYPRTTSKQQKYLYELKEEIVSGNFDNTNYYRILAFIYAIRNAYVHNGETAFAGTEHYIVKLMILTAAYNFMLKFILRSGVLIYDYMIETIS